MSSKLVEDMHTSMLDNLLAASGLVCTRPPYVSSKESDEEESVVEEHHEEEIKEETPESSLITEEKESPMEPVVVEPPVIFPTPSLRRVIPDKIRKIEKQNQIYVLPQTFKSDINPENIPRIKYTAPQKYIEMLGELTGCTKYSSSLAEYWFLDTLANLLRRGQEEDLDKPAQAVLIQWFCQWMIEMAYFDAANRERMLRRFQDNMLSAARFIGDESRLPVPLEAGVYHMPFDEETIQRRNNMLKEYKRKMAQSMTDSKMAVSFEGETTYECSLRDLMKIMHYIFDLFSTDYQYNLVRSVFTFPPEYCLINAPYQINNPRKLYTYLKPSKGKSPKKKEEKVKSAPKSKDGDRHKEKSLDNQEYINLMMLKAYDMQQMEDQEERDREEWNRRSSILPLSFVATEELFDKYWPPPPPPRPPSPETRVSTPDTKRKGKKK